MPQETSVYICFVKTRKKLDKYFKINRIKKKYIIDVKKIIEEEKINNDDVHAKSYFKVLILNKILLAQEKKKDVYYIPNFQNQNLEINKLMNLKTSFQKYHKNFNLLLFFDEFLGTHWLTSIMEELSNFDNSQIFKDY